MAWLPIATLPDVLSLGDTAAILDWCLSSPQLCLRRFGCNACCSCSCMVEAAPPLRRLSIKIEVASLLERGKETRSRKAKRCLVLYSVRRVRRVYP